ncbi:hypothetical protein BUALT_Bualt11G0115200 [Buddleja alternifolia]|uniref:Kinesin-like protein n=1 Tax=Buddleja alternifolia TaxID=168488 RepID=A0AAV6X1I7_9LAMI|nr:hypothetical protein BUALT_Bualt11G0115200 [Buddleja alternifolia]
MDNSKANQQRRWSTPSSMSRTLWSSERSPSKDLQSSDDDHKGVNVQVVLRCRPLTEDEMNAKTSIVISCDELKQEVKVAQSTAYKQVDRAFVFDKVFSPSSQQKELYDNVVAPVVKEVLEGYSWTIFAYGQTGTGKTYTMEVIPRAVEQIFDILESKGSDYSMKVTFLELYNEEITDLLCPDEGSNSPLNDKPKRPLTLMEDAKGSVFVRGLTEMIVYSADEIYAILDKGSARKHTAETLLNKQSNRSHSIFSITIRIKEFDSDGSEVIKCGRFNLVDLAGSENILRSGAREVRAREAGEINKSLLTESKLTRLLRDSLGGKTKTCIIATVSPSALSLEETLSTLDYAFRAKSIKNKPEVNRKVVRSAVVKDLYDQDGEDATKKQLMELQELYIYQQQFTVDLKDKLDITQRELAKTRKSLFNLEDQYRKANDANKEKEKIIFNLLCSGSELTERALELRSDLEGAGSDISSLFARIEHKNYLEDENRNRTKNFHSQLAQQLEDLNKAVSASATDQEQNLKVIQDYTQSFLASKAVAIDELLKKIQNLKDLYGTGIKNLDDSAEELYKNSQSTLSRLSYELSTHSSCIIDLIKKSSSEADTISSDLKVSLNNLESRIAAFIQLQEENHVRTNETSNSISESISNFFKTLSICASKLRLMEEDSQTITNQKLNDFTKKFEIFSLDEERLLLEKMAELLASSNLRKKNLIQAAVGDILESASKRTNNLNQEISNIENFSSDAKEKWTNFIQTRESNFVANSSVITAGKLNIGEGLQSCITKSTEAAEHWKIAEESLLCMLKKNVDSFIKDGTEENERIHDRFSSIASSVIEETDDATKDIMLSVEYPLRLDHEASEKIEVLRTRCVEDMNEINSIHSQKVVEISKVARKSLLQDYMSRVLMLR